MALQHFRVVCTEGVQVARFHDPLKCSLISVRGPELKCLYFGIDHHTDITSMTRQLLNVRRITVLGRYISEAS